MLVASSSKVLTIESKGFAFGVKLVVLDLSSVTYLTHVVCKVLHRWEGFLLCTPKE